MATLEDLYAFRGVTLQGRNAKGDQVIVEGVEEISTREDGRPTIRARGLRIIPAEADEGPPIAGVDDLDDGLEQVVGRGLDLRTKPADFVTRKFMGKG